jgi:MFS transporter, FHS family, L-fucose permease
MGLADAMGPNSDKVKDFYHIGNFQSTLLSFAVFIAFAVFSVPGGLLAARIGKKKLLLLGLGLNAVSLVIPACTIPNFWVLLGCIFLLGVGTTFLQVSGNPIMRDVSAEGQYSRNLAFAQGVKGVGSSASTYLLAAIAAISIFSKMDWRAGFPLFCGLMIIAFVSVLFLKVKESQVEVPPSIASSLSLLKEPIFCLAVIGIFLYVGAEVCMGRFLSPVLQKFEFSKDDANFYGPTAFYAILAIGRILGGAILTVMTPRTCFRLSALLGLLGGVALMGDSKYLAFVGIAASGLGFASIWPMLFSITVEERPGRANELSGLMCMAISGGAIVPLIMGGLIDAGVKQSLAFVVPTACFAYLLAISLRGGRVAPAK